MMRESKYKTKDQLLFSELSPSGSPQNWGVRGAISFSICTLNLLPSPPTPLPTLGEVRKMLKKLINKFN
jgi:hypothetical protein